MSRRPGQIDLGDSDNIPRLSTARYTGAPVECELCSWHERYPLKSFCHVHNVEFGDCFTFGPSTDRPWLAYSEDSSRMAARATPDQPDTVPLDVKRRQNQLAIAVIDTIRRALGDFNERRPLQPSLPVLGQRPPAPRDPPQLSPRLDGAPMWTGRSCNHCSLNNDYGSYVHIHMPERGLCWTFGERGDRAVSIPGPLHFPLGTEETEECRLKRRTWLEGRVRHTVMLFYWEQNHLARHRRDWRRRLKQEKLEGVEPSPGESHWTEDGKWRHRCCHPDRMMDFGYRFVRNYSSSTCSE